MPRARGGARPGVTADEAPFLYFAFGSNLDADRLHIHCPSARLIATARLAGHRLAFSLESKRNWHGGVADVRPSPGDEVWGALWVIAGGEGGALDEQEGVFRDPPAYRRITVDVETPAGDAVRCRSYQVVTPDPTGFAPSPAYRQTILRGARAIGLPASYVTALEALADNGYEGGGPG